MGILFVHHCFQKKTFGLTTDYPWSILWINRKYHFPMEVKFLEKKGYTNVSRMRIFL